MALNLLYPLKKGTYHIVRGYASHVKHNPGTWYGDDDSCKIGTQGYAEEDGYISLAFKRKTGGGWSFLLNFTKYPGWGSWHAHCSWIPKNGDKFKRGQKMFKTGATGDVDGAHLHHSLLHREGPYLVAKNLDSKSVVKWEHRPMYLTKTQKTKICRDLLGRKCSSASYKAKLTREDLMNRAYKEISSNLKKLNLLRTTISELKKRHDKDLDKWLDIIKIRGVELGKRDKEIIELLGDKDNLQKLLDTCIEKSQEKEIEKVKVNRFSGTFLILKTFVGFVWKTLILPKLKLLRKEVNKYGRDK